MTMQFNSYSPDVYMVIADDGRCVGNLVRTTSNRWVINDSADRKASTGSYRTLREAKKDAERVLT